MQAFFTPELPFGAPQLQGWPLSDSREPSDGGDLDRRIAEAQAKHSRGVSSAEARAESRGWAVGIEFVGTVLVATFIGWAIDNWSGLGSKPWGMIVMLVLGFAAGVRRAIQTSAQFDSDPGNDPEA
jgi:ATP synthase protein I